MARQLLLVDDDPAIISALRRILRNHEFSIVTAGCAEDALTLMRRSPAAVVLSDYRMPGMDGIQLLSEIAASWPDTVRLILSGNTDSEVILNGDSTGVVHHFLAKPWSTESLNAVLEQAFSSSADVDLMVAESGLLAGTEPPGPGCLQEQELINHEALERLAADVSEAMLPELVSLFMKSVRDCLADIDTAEKQDTVVSVLPGIRRQLHSLGSSMALYGLQLCSDEARRLEKAPAAELSPQLAKFTLLARHSLQALSDSLSERNKTAY